MLQLSPERKYEIVLTILVAKLDDEGGLNLGSDTRRRMGEWAKKGNATMEEMEALLPDFVTRFTGKTLKKSHVSMTISDDDPKKTFEVHEL